MGCCESKPDVGDPGKAAGNSARASTPADVHAVAKPSDVIVERTQVGASQSLSNGFPSPAGEQLPAGKAAAQHAAPQGAPASSEKQPQSQPQQQPQQQQQTGGKTRRAAAASEAVRDQIRKLAVGGPQAKEEKEKIYVVSDSEDEGLDEETYQSVMAKSDGSQPPEVTAAITAALQQQDMFRGIPGDKLGQVVGRMMCVYFPSGAVVVKQGALPKEDDCMYYLQSGEVEIVISGGGEAAGRQGEERTVEGHVVRISKKPGWIFGDVALLFNSARTASVVAKGDITVWALDRKTFLLFVMRHAPGARKLRYLRKLPLLKGLSDIDLLSAAAQMPERVYKDGQPLIRIGERGDELFLIRYGKVRVFRPDGNGDRVEVAVLGRGQFVGERAVINDKLRSADCVASGDVLVVVLKKRDFINLDNPLLAMMIDYDAVSAVLRSLAAFKGLKQEQMENILERFDPRSVLPQGATIINRGDPIDRLFVVKIGEVALYKGEERVEDPAFVREVAGFSYFGESAITSIVKSPYTIKVAAETLHFLTLSKQQVDSFMGRDQGLRSEEAVVAALKKSKYLSNVRDHEFKELLKACEVMEFSRPGEIIASANGGSEANRVYLVRSGEVAVVAADLPLPPSGPGGPLVDVARLGSSERQRLVAGGVFNDRAVGNPEMVSLEASLVAATTCSIITFTTADVNRVLGGRTITRRPTTVPGTVDAPRFSTINFSELELHRIVGVGQFGMVRVVRHVPTNEAYALKIIHKGPIVEPKAIENMINERRILEEAQHPFCVRLCGAYQDRHCLYLLQEWVPGGELFHHLAVMQQFDEPTAMFYAANVLLALEYLHAKGIVYRDLKPENLLMDTQGYIKVADYGFAKHIGGGKTYTICGTPDYQAPEVIDRLGTTKAADYWALGVLIFEMLVGDPPFKSLTGDPWDTFRRARTGRVYVPEFISQTAADLIFKLLQVNPDRRLGSDKRLGAEEIKRHRWFSRIDWKALEARRLPTPFKPQVRNPLDTSNFDSYDQEETMRPPPVPPERVEMHNSIWELWDWCDT